MPYITPEQRTALSTRKIPVSAGELNFVITMAVQDYLGLLGTSYANLNDVLGVLEAVKLELYRRVVAPFEDRKMKENGDVW